MKSIKRIFVKLGIIIVIESIIFFTIPYLSKYLQIQLSDFKIDMLLGVIVAYIVSSTTDKIIWNTQNDKKVDKLQFELDRVTRDLRDLEEVVSFSHSSKGGGKSATKHSDNT